MASRPVVLHLGFLNIPYTAKAMADPMRAARSVLAKRQHRGVSSTMTAEDVGNILENKYNIVEVFLAMHNDEIIEPIIEKFEDVVVEALTEKYKTTRERNIQNMRPKTIKIEKLFREFLNNEEMSGELSKPVKAAQIGKWRRRTGRPGPPFIDTGIYRAAFRAWIDVI
jgi:hypothetical protein